MSFVSFKIIKRLPPPKVALESIEGEVRKAVEPVARQFVAERRRITDHFSHKPEWEHKINIRETGLQVLILLKNARSVVSGRVTMGQLLEWLFVTGTKSHRIAAKPGKVLSFLSGGKGSYDRITPRSGTTPGAGTIRSAEPVITRVVIHPGFKPSPALGRINQKLGGALTRAFRLGIANGLRRISKG